MESQKGILSLDYVKSCNLSVIYKEEMFFQSLFQICKCLRAHPLQLIRFSSFFAPVNSYLFLFVLGEKKEIDKTASKDGETDKPDKDSSNL